MAPEFQNSWDHERKWNKQKASSIGDDVCIIPTFKGKEPTKEIEKGTVRGIKEKPREGNIKKSRKEF